MPVKRFLTLILIASGCARVPVAKLSHAEAFGRPPADPRTSPALQAALAAFSERLEAARRTATRGQKMEAAPAEAWLSILAELEPLLALAPGRTSPYDLVRARLILQTQLSADAQQYGDFPPAVAEGAQQAIRRLSAQLAFVAPVQRLAELRRFVWPLEPVVITSPFGYRVHPISGDYRFHAGLDLLADPAQPVRAAFDGLVVFSAWNGAHGKQVELQHDPKRTTRYSHLEVLLVPEGQRVKRGEVIGLAGSTGTSTGVHLHFELTRDGEPEDPEEAIAPNGTSPGFPQSSSENPPNAGVRAEVTAWP